MEVYPGVEEVLRGSAETLQAVKEGAVTSVQCFCCCQEVLCIHDAAFFICPSCKIIGSVPDGVWGVGLGVLASAEEATAPSYES